MSAERFTLAVGHLCRIRAAHPTRPRRSTSAATPRLLIRPLSRDHLKWSVTSIHQLADKTSSLVARRCRVVRWAGFSLSTGPPVPREHEHSLRQRLAPGTLARGITLNYHLRGLISLWQPGTSALSDRHSDALSARWRSAATSWRPLLATISLPICGKRAPSVRDTCPADTLTSTASARPRSRSAPVRVWFE